MYCSFLRNVSAPADGPETPFVHPFYRDSFASLYHISKERIPECGEVPVESRDFLLRVLRNVWDASGERKVPDYYFDVRTTEEFSRTAPDYALLHALGFLNTTPLSVKGLGSLALIESFFIASVSLAAEQTALMSVCERYQPFDSPKYKNMESRAAAFQLSKDKGELLLERFGFADSLRQIREIGNSASCDVFLVRKELAGAFGEKTETVSSEFVDPLIAIRKRVEHSGAFCAVAVLSFGERLGYYCVRRG